jgi:hypothetical protein
MNSLKKLKAAGLFMLLLISSMTIAGNKRYWIGNGTNKNWNATSNWSETSGGAGGAAVPGSTDSVYFDANGSGQLILNADMTIKMLTMGAYADTIKQNNKIIWIGGDCILNDGTFWGDAGTISVIGNFTLAGARFKSTSSTLTISGNSNFLSGFFLHGNGTVRFANTSMISGSADFYDVLLLSGAAAVYTFDIASVFNITHLLTQSGSQQIKINGGTVNVQGNILHTGTMGVAPATGTLNINGSGNQTITGVSNLTYGGFCNVKINKPSGVLYLKNVINVYGTWEHVHGAVNDTTYDAQMSFNTGGTHVVKGTQTFNKLWLGTGGNSTSFTVNAGDTLTVDFIHTGVSNSIVYGGYINVTGDFWMGSTGISGGGTGTIIFSGTKDQLLTGQTLTIKQGTLPNIKINKTGGKLTLKNIITVGGNWQHQQGKIDAITENSTLCFVGGIRTISETDSLNNVTFYAGSVHTNTIASSLTVLGNLILSGTSPITNNTGTIHAMGHVTSTNTVSSTGGGSGYIRICGTDNQDFTGNGIALGGVLCNVTIDKPSGVLTLFSIISMASTSTWRYIKGEVNPGNSTVIFMGGSGSTINSGTPSLSMEFYNVTVQGGTGSVLASALNLKNTLEVAASRTLTTNNYDVTIGKDFYGLGTISGGTSTFTLNGSGRQVLQVGSTLYKVKINKPSGKAYLNYNLNISNSLSLVKGVIVSPSGTNLVKLLDNATTDGGSDESYVSGSMMKIGNDAFTFPLGDTTLADTSAYHPFSITAPTAVTDAFTAQYFAKNQLTDHPTFTSVQNSLKSISTCEYWSLTRNTGTSVVLPTVSWNNNSCNINILSELQVAGWDGSQWKNMGQASRTGDSLKGTITAVSPGINATNQYYTTGNIPHLLVFDTQGLDTVAASDTLRYTVSGAGLTGTYIAGSIQNLYPTLPAIGTVSIITISFTTKSNQSLVIEMKLTSIGEVKNPRIISIGPAEPACASGCVALGTAIKINECLLKNCFRLSNTVYAVLNRELDGGYFKIINGDFRFKFEEEYNDSDGKLSYRLYNNKHELLLSSKTLAIQHQYNSGYGTRYFSINIQGCYNNSPLANDYYMIEVENEKKEVWIARVKNTNVGNPIGCQSQNPGDIFVPQ